MNGILLLFRRHGGPSEGGHQDQPVAVSAGERHLGTGRRQEQTHPLPGLQTDPTAAGEGRQGLEGSPTGTPN